MSIVPAAPSTQRPTPRQLEKGLDRLLSVQRPVVLAHIRAIRARDPHASPAR